MSDDHPNYQIDWPKENLVESKRMLESCRMCGEIGDCTGRRELWNDDVVQYLCDQCCKAMGRVRFCLVPKEKPE